MYVQSKGWTVYKLSGESATAELERRVDDEGGGAGKLRRLSKSPLRTLISALT